jgi:uncharacterized protein YkwD
MDFSKVPYLGAKRALPAAVLVALLGAFAGASLGLAKRGPSPAVQCSMEDEAPLPASPVPAAIAAQPPRSIGEAVQVVAGEAKPAARETPSVYSWSASGPEAFQARNPVQRFTARADANGLEVRPDPRLGVWKLRLRTRAGEAPAESSAREERLELRRGETTEWYFNRPHGLEQGFTVLRPSQSGSLRVELDVEGTLTPVLRPGADGLVLRNGDGRAVLAYRHLRAWDAKGCELAAHMELDGRRLALAVDTVGAAWPVTIDPELVLASPPPQTLEEDLVTRTNQERWNNGQLAPLRYEPANLGVAAEYHCEDMYRGNFFDHKSLGSQVEGCHFYLNEEFYQRFTPNPVYGYTYYYDWVAAAENIAAGQPTPEDAMSAWMISPDHQANILSTSYREIGTGHFYIGASYQHWWCQDFGRRNNVYPVVINREAHVTGTANVQLYAYGSGSGIQRRFRNENLAWSAWETHNGADRSWNLSDGNGLKTVYFQRKDAGGNIQEYSDSIYLDAPTILQFEVASYTVSENGGSATLRVVRSGDLSDTVSVQWATSDGTAGASDYTPSNGTLTFTDGTPRTFSVNIANDTALEYDETFTVSLSVLAGNAAIGPIGTAAVTIEDNDNQPPSFTQPASGPAQVSGVSAALTSSATDLDGWPGSVTYTWSQVSGPGASSFNPNGTTNGDTTVTFNAAGDYVFRVTASDGAKSSTSDTATVQVLQVASDLAVLPPYATVQANRSVQLAAVLRDQFGASMPGQPGIAWSVNGGGWVDANGWYRAGGKSGGPYTVTATGGGFSGQGYVKIKEKKRTWWQRFWDSILGRKH